MIAIEQHPTASHVGDVVAIGITVGAFFDFLPKIAALLSVIWLFLQIMRFCTTWYREETRRRGHRRRHTDKLGGYHGDSPTPHR